MNLTGESFLFAPSCLGLAAYVLLAHLYIADIQAIYKLAILYHYILNMSIFYTVIGSISCIYGFYIPIRYIIIYKQKSDYKSRFLSCIRYELSFCLSIYYRYNITFPSYNLKYFSKVIFLFFVIIFYIFY